LQALNSGSSSAVAAACCSARCELRR
jgi:hypothetical protein